MINCSAPVQMSAVFRGDSPLYFNLTSMSLTEADINSLSLNLNRKPTDNVVVTLSSSSTRVAINPLQITFTPDNYDQPQTITVSGVNNCKSDTDETISITTSIASADTQYSTAAQVSIPVKVRDASDNLPQISFQQTSEIVTSELGTIAFFTVNLSCAPTADVTIPLVVDKQTEVSVSPTSLVFTSANFSTLQTVTITGLPDCIADGNKTFVVSSGNVSTLDTRFARYTNAAGSSQIHSQVSGTNNDYQGSSDTNISLSSGSMDMTLDFTNGHPDPFISFSVSLTCPVTTTVYFGFLATDTTNTANFSLAAGAFGATTSFAKVKNTTFGNSFLSFNSTNWSSPQSVLIALDTVTANLAYMKSTTTGYNLKTPVFSDSTVHKIKMFQSQGDVAQTAVATPAYAAKTLNVNITVNSW